MRRRLLNLVTALSLLLCVSVTALWIRSYLAADRHDWLWLSQTNDPKGDFAPVHRYAGIRLHYSRGRALVERFDAWSSARVPVPVPFWQFESGEAVAYDVPSESIWVRIGFERYSFPSGAFGVGFPFWLPAVATAALPGFWIFSSCRRRFRTAAGHCASCGYDLRATPGRCPECGREATRRTDSPSTSPPATLVPRS